MNGDLGPGKPWPMTTTRYSSNCCALISMTSCVSSSLRRWTGWNLSSPEFLDKELFAGGPRGPRRELDLLVRIRTVNGRPLMIHVEIEARASSAWRSASGATATR